MCRFKHCLMCTMVLSADDSSLALEDGLLELHGREPVYIRSRDADETLVLCHGWSFRGGCCWHVNTREASPAGRVVAP